MTEEEFKDVVNRECVCIPAVQDKTARDKQDVAKANETNIGETAMTTSHSLFNTNNNNNINKTITKIIVIKVLYYCLRCYCI